MTKKRSTKRALLMSALSLMTCVSMLIGSTFAWFTDSVTSAGNIIKSGKLDVTMEWKDATATGKQLTYKDASEGAIFNYDRWEPGYVEAKNVKISNVGTLALKYELNITATEEECDLADVIDVYFAEGEYTLESREMTELTLAGTLADILDGMPANMSGALKASETDTVTIALKMQEGAGNDYQDLSIDSEFSIVLMATQDNVEFDSFDENYDDIEVPEKDIKVIEGNTYHYYQNGDVALVEVPYGNVGETFTVNSDVTMLGIGVDRNDTNGPVFSKYSPITTLTLNEGLVSIGARAINTPTLTTVNFPSTLKSIGEQAFRLTGMTVLTIPANVEVIKDGAFRDMANLTTVTVEGNAEIGNFAFRSCPNLQSVYLLGDDVTFTGTSQFASHADNGDANGITIYVKNATVAARVYAAQSSATDFEVKILGENGSISNIVDDAEDLATALAKGENVTLSEDVSTTATTEAPYGNKVGIIQNGGVLDGNGNALSVECSGDDYGIMTSGGTIKNLTIDSGCRAIMIMSPTGDIIVDKVNIGGDGVLYAINTGEAGADGVKLSVTNSTLAGWTSYGPVVESASFTNVKFEQGEYKDYASIYGRVLKPYVNTTLTDCSFIEHMNLDLSSLTEGHKVTFTNCTVNGQDVTADVFTPYSGDDSVYDNALFSVDLPSWADSIDDCIIFN